MIKTLRKDWFVSDGDDKVKFSYRLRIAIELEYKLEATLNSIVSFYIK